MASVPPIDIAVRKTGRPRIYTEEEIKECRREQMRQYLTKKKETKVNKPKSTVIGCPCIYTNEEAKQKREKALVDTIRKTGSAASSSLRDVSSIARPRP